MRRMRRRALESLAANRVILSNAGSMVGAMGVTAGLGVVYWWVATHNFAETEVGSASASISAMLLLGSLGVFGFTTLVIGELPRMRGREGSFISTALIVSACVAALFGAAFALIAPEIAAGFEPLRSDARAVFMFAAGTSFVALALVIDSVFLALLRSEFQFARNVLMAASKLLGLFGVAYVMAHGSTTSIIATWVVGTLLSFVVPGWFLVVRRHAFGSWRPQWSVLRGLGRGVLAHHSLNLSLQVPGMALPVVVTTLLSAKANAYFYAAWLIAGFLFFVPSTMTSVLYAIGAGDRSALAHKMRFTVGVSTVIGIGANVIFMLLGSRLLSTFGRAYAEQGNLVLILLALAVFPLTIKNHFIAVHRVNDLTARAARYAAIGGIVEIAFASLGARSGGIIGLSIGWTLAISLEALLMAYQVWHLLVLSPASNHNSPTCPRSASPDTSDLLVSSMRVDAGRERRRGEA